MGQKVILFTKLSNFSPFWTVNYLNTLYNCDYVDCFND